MTRPALAAKCVGEQHTSYTTPRDVVIADDVADEVSCLKHLLTYQVDSFRRGRKASLGGWIEWAAEDPPPPGVEFQPPADDDDTRPATPAAANRILATFGLKVLRDVSGEGKFGLPWLAVFNQHAQLAQVFQGTHWASRSGAIGVWAQALRRLPGAMRSPRNVRFGAASTRCTLIPLRPLQGEDVTISEIGVTVASRTTHWTC